MPSSTALVQPGRGFPSPKKNLMSDLFGLQSTSYSYVVIAVMVVVLVVVLLVVVVVVVVLVVIEQ